MAAPPMVGGVSGMKPIDETATALALQHRAAAEAKLGVTFNTFNPVGFATQVVAGLNYYIEVEVDDGKRITLKIWKKLDQTSQFTDATHA